MISFLEASVDITRSAIIGSTVGYVAGRFFRANPLASAAILGAGLAADRAFDCVADLLESSHKMRSSNLIILRSVVKGADVAATVAALRSLGIPAPTTPVRSSVIVVMILLAIRDASKKRKLENDNSLFKVG